MPIESRSALMNRRQQLRAVLASAASVWAAPWSQAQGRADPPGRLIVVFLRGACDGLSALVPYADPHYHAMRPHIALPKPDGTGQTTLALDATFGLHPALSPLWPLWQQGVLTAIACAGSPDRTRSHFDAQHHWETGLPGSSSASTGWLNSLSAQTQSQAIGVGEANPRILVGPQAVQRVPSGDAATRKGVLTSGRTRDAVLRLYDGDDPLSQSFRAGVQSRGQTADMLSQSPPEMDAVMQAASNGAGHVKGLVRDAQHLATLMRNNPRLRLGFLSAGGWDTHANQGASAGHLANQLAQLANAVLVLRQAFAGSHDVVALVSEFGRTAAENGTRGTDHGHGNALWLLGNRVQGGRWHGRWDGLAQERLHEGRDLPVHHDFRAVFAQVLRSTFGHSAAQLDALFPGFVWDRELDALMGQS